MHDRIFVTIAVSNPKELAELPGAVTAATRMASWADANGYRVVRIEESGGPVTIERIQKVLTPVLAEIAPLNRLVIFFAGHGSAKDANMSYWLLTNWSSNWSEAIDVSAFQRVLRFYGPRQVAMIGDCCRVLHKTFLDVRGSQVLDTPETEPVDYELDRFFAADAGEEAFMIPAFGSNDAFCIFTEVLLDALEGDASDAFDVRRAGERTVTSGSLGEYLKRAVPVEAKRHNVVMTPKADPAFYRDDVYARFPPLAGATEPPSPAPAGEGGGPDPTAMGPSRRTVPKVHLLQLSADASSEAEERGSQELEERQQRADRYGAFNARDVPTHFETGSGLAVLGVEQASVETSTGMVMRDPNRPEIWFPLYVGGGGMTGKDWANLIVELDRDRHAYVCGVHGFIATLQIHDSDRASVIYRRLQEKLDRAQPSINLLAKANAGLLGSEGIVNAAAVLRHRKHDDFTLGCLASYLYDSIGDVESIRSIAAFYAGAGQIVPLDVALLSDGLLYFDHGILFVDIPAVPKREPRTKIEAERQFTFAETSKIDRALVGGTIPWMRGGWTAIATARFDESAHQWRKLAEEVAKHLAPSPFTMVRGEGLEPLADMAGVQIRQMVEL